MRNILTLSGSIREGSFNQKLQAHVSAKLRDAGADVTEINLGDFDMPIFNEDLEPDNVPATAAKLADLFREHDAVFIATPEYNGGLPPLLINTLTWLSRQSPSPYRDRLFGIGGVSSGKYGTTWALAHLRDSLSKVGGLVVPGLLGIGPASDAFDENGAPVEPAIQRKVDQLVTALTTISITGK